MFTWLGDQLSAVLDTYVLDVVAALAEALAPVALTAMSLWVLLYGWAVLRGEVNQTVPNFLWSVTKISLVLVLASPAAASWISADTLTRTLWLLGLVSGGGAAYLLVLALCGIRPREVLHRA